MPDVREKLVELLRSVPRAEEVSIGRGSGKSFVRLAIIADHLIANGVTIQRWIPANERKPQEFVSVLIYAPGEVPLPAVHEAYFARGCWVTHITVLNEHEVTHWMDMPEGPEEVE